MKRRKDGLSPLSRGTEIIFPQSSKQLVRNKMRLFFFLNKLWNKKTSITYVRCRREGGDEWTCDLKRTPRITANGLGRFFFLGGCVFDSFCGRFRTDCANRTAQLAWKLIREKKFRYLANQCLTKHGLSGVSRSHPLEPFWFHSSAPCHDFPSFFFFFSFIFFY